jgi:ABC-2 type transport system ATP-binding protein
VDVISIDQVTRSYGRRRGIEEVTLSVKPGEIFGFLGPNGAGKTTMIRILLGFLRPGSGTARILDLDCWSQSAIVQEVRGRHEILLRGRELLDRFQLDDTVPVRKMSRGMRQKLGIVLALAHNPRLLILDEPTSGLDPIVCEELYRCLREVANAEATVFFSSHTLSEVELLCERVAIVRAGRLVADESMESLRRRAHRVVTLHFQRDFDATSLRQPDFLEIKERSPHLWRGELTGSAHELVIWAAKVPLTDFEVGPPPLEGLFRSYYEPVEAAT